MTEANDAARSRAGSILVLALALIALYYLIQLPSVWFGRQNWLGAPAGWVENAAWLYMTGHHLAQMFLALLVIAIASRGRVSEWGLNLRNWRMSLSITREVTVVFVVIMVVSVAVQLAAGAPPRSAPPLTFGHVAGTLFFMAVISGLSEEILFRGMMQSWLARWTGAEVALLGWRLSLAGLVTAVIFAAVHVNFTLSPLAVTHLYWPQVITALVLGLVYAWAYDRTSSLLAPILLHNFSNGLMAGGNLLVAAWQ